MLPTGFFAKRHKIMFEKWNILNQREVAVKVRDPRIKQVGALKQHLKIKVQSANFHREGKYVWEEKGISFDS